MTWVRTSDTFTELPVWEELGPAAHFLHMAALSYCNRSGTDGIITRARARALTPVVDDVDALVDGLVAAGMWSETPAGLKVAKYTGDLRRADGRGDEQPAAIDVKNRRTTTAERQSKWRAERKAEREAAVSNLRDNGVMDGVPPRVTNTVQARPGQSRRELVSGLASRRQSSGLRPAAAAVGLVAAEPTVVEFEDDADE